MEQISLSPKFTKEFFTLTPEEATRWGYVAEGIDGLNTEVVTDPALINEWVEAMATVEKPRYDDQIGCHVRPVESADLESVRDGGLVLLMATTVDQEKPELFREIWDRFNNSYYDHALEAGLKASKLILTFNRDGTALTAEQIAADEAYYKRDSTRDNYIKGNRYDSFVVHPAVVCFPPSR